MNSRKKKLLIFQTNITKIQKSRKYKHTNLNASPIYVPMHPYKKKTYIGYPV